MMQRIWWRSSPTYVSPQELRQHPTLILLQIDMIDDSEATDVWDLKDSITKKRCPLVDVEASVGSKDDMDV